MSITFGFDQMIKGQGGTNGFSFKEDGTSPANLGIFGYKHPKVLKDWELNTIPSACKPFHNHHYFGLMNHFDIEIERVDKIKDKYYYVIDVFPYEFWLDPESLDITLNVLVAHHLKNKKCKILVINPLEAIRLQHDAIGLVESWVKKYDLPEKSVVISSGNYSYGDTTIKDNKYITYIPYSQWEHSFRSMYSEQTTEELTSCITERVNRKKVFLNYNRRARYYRCKLVYEWKNTGIFDSGLVSLGSDLGFERTGIPDSFYDNLPITFDDTDLEINHATELVPEDFKNSYVSVVSETIVEPNELFPTEKIFKAIVGMHPFIVVATPGFLELLKGFGYKTFSKWFDESYDKEEDLQKRIDMIVNEVKKLTLKKESELQDMLVEMLPTLKHNMDVFLKRTVSKEFQNQLEAELWK